MAGYLDEKHVSFTLKFQYPKGQGELHDWTGVYKKAT
jgi:hypothetical protein